MNKDLQSLAYCDAGWASCLDTRRSITAFCIFMGNSLVSWRTKKQSTVSRSSTEAEYRSMGSTTGEIQWVTYLLRDLDIEYTQPICIKCDNNAALHITANPIFHERTKHLEIDCHLVREEFQKGLILPQYILSKSQVANVFMKSLAKPQFMHLISKLGLDDAHQSPA